MQPSRAAFPTGAGPGMFPHSPELCAFLLANAGDLGIPFPVTPAMLADLGLELPPAAAVAFLEAVSGRMDVPPRA